jgi:hypothetical protein
MTVFIKTAGFINATEPYAGLPEGIFRRSEEKQGRKG